MTTSVKISAKVDWMRDPWPQAFTKATGIIEEMRDWCIITLDVGAWKMENYPSGISGLTKVFIFDCPEDATAFKIRFGVI